LEVSAVVDVVVEVFMEFAYEDCDDVEGLLEVVLLPKGLVEGSDRGGRLLLLTDRFAVAMSGGRRCCGERGVNADEDAEVGRKGTPRWGEAGRIGETGLSLTGETGLIEGEDDVTPEAKFGDGKAVLPEEPAEVEPEGVETEEGKMVEAVARIVGEGSNCPAAAEAGLLVILFDE
jgi:hypothetical protein